MKNLLIALCAALYIAMSASAMAQGTESASTEQTILYVDINKDSAEKMSDLLIGVGAKKAEAIVQYREQNGPFNSAEELVNVPGIGASTLQKNYEAIVVGDI